MLLQAFVRLSLENSEIIFVAEADSNLLYKFDLDVNAKAKDFGSKSGKYGIHLIIGDSVISNSVAWHLADINLKFSGDEDGQQVKALFYGEASLVQSIAAKKLHFDFIAAALKFHELRDDYL